MNVSMPIGERRNKENEKQNNSKIRAQSSSLEQIFNPLLNYFTHTPKGLGSKVAYICFSSDINQIPISLDLILNR